MSDTENLVQFCSAYGVKSVSNTITFNDTKLQTLDRRVGAEQLYFGKEWFEKSLNAWDGIPLIYNKTGEHPSNFKAVAENPAKAAEHIGGKFVGAVRNPRIVLEGGARLMATLEISEDEKEIYELWQAGKLFPSTAFSVFSDGDKITSAPIPNHVLLFPEIKDKVQPGDFGAYVNSVVVDTSEEKPMAEEIQAENAEKKKSCHSFYEKIVEALKSVFTEDGKLKEEVTESEKVEETHSETVTEEKPVSEQTDVVESVTEVAEPTQEVETPVENTQQTEETQPEVAEIAETNSVTAEEAPKADERDAQIDALNSEIAALKAQVAKQAQEEQEKKFSQFLDTFVPEGMKATDAQRAELREKYNSDVVSLMFSIRAEQEKAGSGETSKVGEEYAIANSHVKALCSVGDLSGKN